MIYVNVSQQWKKCQECKVKERLYHFSYEYDGLFFDDVCLNCMAIQFTDTKMRGEEAKIILNAMNVYQRSPFFASRTNVIVIINEDDVF